MKNYIVTGCIALIVSLVIALGFGGTTVVEKFSGDAGPTHYDLQEFLGGVVKGNYRATSTVATAYTLIQRDIDRLDTISLTPNTADLTLTFFASSSVPSWIPKAGNMQETCIRNATTTAGIDIIFAAGTGIDIETASSSPTDLTLLAGNTACFKFIRQASTATTFDITALMNEYTNGD